MPADSPVFRHRDSQRLISEQLDSFRPQGYVKVPVFDSPGPPRNQCRCQAFVRRTNDFDTERALPKLGYSFKGTSVWLGAAWIEETFETGATFDDVRIDVAIERTD